MIPILDQILFTNVDDAEKEIEDCLGCDLIHYFGEIRQHDFVYFRDAIEKIASRDDRKDAIGICLTTPGGEVEVVEKMVEVIRYHYKNVVIAHPPGRRPTVWGVRG